MSNKKHYTSYPVIDIFAGPGGLSEGFSAFGRYENRQHFKIALSVEKDRIAHNTLELRSFFRQFHNGSVPESYYAFLRNEISIEDLYKKYPDEAKHAQNETWCAELGSGEEFNDELDARITKAIDGNSKWVLLGGPPCQAYSLAGRSRNKGVAGYIPEEDDRHFLYREYLRILARHWPAIFIMENVKGILSSSINGNSIFGQIIDDLSNPFNSLSQYRGSTNKAYKCYKIFSLVKEAKGKADLLGQSHNDAKDFVIAAEHYGIPQRRHRVILLGIRNDLLTVKPALLNIEKTISVSNAINGLPRLRSGLSKSNDSKESWKSKLNKACNSHWMKNVKIVAGNEVYKLMLKTIRSLNLPQKDRGAEFIKCSVTIDEDLKCWVVDPKIQGVCNHSSRGHMTEDLYRYLFASCYAKIHGVSPKLKDYPDDLLPFHKNVRDGHFADRFRVQISGNPSTTITSHISKDGHYYIHPDPSQCRSLTVREAARLQTFPDNYFFAGPRTLAFRQISNATQVI